MTRDYTKDKAINQQVFKVVELEEHRQTISGTLPEDEVVYSGYGQITRTESIIAGKILTDDSSVIASDGRPLKGRAKAEAIIMYYDMALNQDGTVLKLSRKRFEDLYGIQKNQYLLARDRLKAAGYLTPDPDRRDGFLFWRVPKEQSAIKVVAGEPVADPEDIDDTPEDLPEAKEVLQRFTLAPETAAPAEDSETFIARLRAEYADSEDLEEHLSYAFKRVSRYTNADSMERALLEELEKVERALQFGRRLREEKRAAAPETGAPAARQDDGQLPF